MTQHIPLDLERARTALAGSPIGHHLVFRAAVDSTMNYARSAELPTGAIVVAEEQSAGKGRLGRTWSAPAGAALLCTAVLRPPLLPQPPTAAPLVAGLAVIDAVAGVSPPLAARLALKWPNDVLVAAMPGGGKVAGILIETAFHGESARELLLGIGINVHQSTDELAALPPAAVPPTSLVLAGATTVTRTDLLVALCRTLVRRLEQARQAPALLLEEWRSRLQTLGQTVTVTQPGEGIVATGRAVDATSDGSLVIEVRGGRRVVVASGDVTLRSV